jgi:hypothetical protein
LERDSEGQTLKLHQSKFIETVLKRFGMENCTPVQNPTDQLFDKLSKAQSPKTSTEKDEMKDKPYRSLIGSLMYLMVATRPDLAYPLGRLSSFLENPGPAHWTAATRLLRYLAGTRDHGIVFNAASDRPYIPVGYCDASFAADITDRKSSGGHVFIACGGPISWRAKKQSSVARSTVESEYVECADAAAEAKFLHMFYDELGWNLPRPMEIFTDSQGALAITCNPVNRERTKHIDIQYHFTRDLVEKGEIVFRYVTTKNQIADFLTKALPTNKFEMCREAVGVLA